MSATAETSGAPELGALFERLLPDPELRAIVLRNSGARERIELEERVAALEARIAKLEAAQTDHGLWRSIVSLSWPSITDTRPETAEASLGGGKITEDILRTFGGSVPKLAGLKEGERVFGFDKNSVEIGALQTPQERGQENLNRQQSPWQLNNKFIRQILHSLPRLFRRRG